MCFFSAKAFLISAIITVKIVCSGFLASYTSGVAPIIWISKMLSKLRLSLVSYIVSYLGLSLIVTDLIRQVERLLVDASKLEELMAKI